MTRLLASGRSGDVDGAVKNRRHLSVNWSADVSTAESPPSSRRRVNPQQRLSLGLDEKARGERGHRGNPQRSDARPGVRLASVDVPNIFRALISYGEIQCDAR